MTTRQQKRIRIVGVPMDLGQMRRGVDMGPSAIRYAGLAARLARLGHTINDAGNIDVPVREHLMQADRGVVVDTIRRACEQAYEQGREAVSAGEFFDEVAAAQVKARVQEIIDLYYPPGQGVDGK